MSTPTITRSTGITISVAVLVSIVGMAYVFGSETSSLKSETARNTKDIVSILSQIDSLNKNLVTTNGNIIQLNEKLNGLTAQINRVTVARPSPQPKVVVVASQGPTQPIQPANQPPQNEVEPQPADPAPQAEPLPCTLLPLLCYQGRFL